MPAKVLWKCLLSILLLAGVLPNGTLAETQIRTVSSDAQGTVLEFDAQGFSLEQVREQGITYCEVGLPGAGRSSKEGTPLLPLKGFLVGLPEEAEPSVQVLETDYIDRPDTLVSPCPRRLLREEDGRQRFVYEPYRLEEAYGSEGYFPGVLVELQDGGYLRGLRVARVVIHPAQADLAGRQLRLYTRIRFRLAYGAPLVSQGVQRPSDREPESYARILAEHIVNYEAVTTHRHDLYGSERLLGLCGWGSGAADRGAGRNPRGLCAGPYILSKQAAGRAERHLLPESRRGRNSGLLVLGQVECSDGKELYRPS